MEVLFRAREDLVVVVLQTDVGVRKRYSVAYWEPMDQWVV